MPIIRESAGLLANDPIRSRRSAWNGTMAHAHCVERVVTMEMSSSMPVEVMVGLRIRTIHEEANDTLVNSPS
jgi:hypothetical protein